MNFTYDFPVIDGKKRRKWQKKLYNYFFSRTIKKIIVSLQRHFLVNVGDFVL